MVETKDPASVVDAFPEFPTINTSLGHIFGSCGSLNHAPAYTVKTRAWFTTKKKVFSISPL